jgi:hypothetical protein
MVRAVAVELVEFPGLVVEAVVAHVRRWRYCYIIGVCQWGAG